LGTKADDQRFRVEMFDAAVRSVLFVGGGDGLMRLTEIAQVCSLKFLTRAAWSL
jgi:hypothetical protein